MKQMIGVIGSGKSASKKDIKIAREVGEVIAVAGYVLLSGGMDGVMKASCQGARKGHGLVVGICPTYDKKDLNKFVDIPIVTGMRGGRNFINVLSSDTIISIGCGSAGTLSEIAFALALDKKLIVVGGSQKMKEFISEIPTKSFISFVDTAKEVQILLKKR